MPKGTPDDPHTTPAPYPMRGYIFNLDGTHEGGETLKNIEDLYGFIYRSRAAAKDGHEIMVTDADDFCNIQVKDRVLIFPRENVELVWHYED
ncbi:MAG: hypothetical protein AVDCRST_MAG93-5654 [uncultured Chloroflexia bacterium]|uniref:Uncharacterized protein n=1 Tax=uncultured Chloroflexia bacterium TaxID=1672391 RepID=A0A6J4KYH4_9CHLR|nr:MAG: hypothetical protein AVDCRST_MAG93-5654 [uncultured Chloroflexia bacterium]